MPTYGGSVGVGYNPGMQTRVSLNMPEIPPVEGIDYGGLLNALARMRGRTAGDQREAFNIRNQERPQAPDPNADIRRFFTVKSDLDRQMDPLSTYHMAGITNRNFFNMPAASALTFGKDIFPNGFDTTANLMAGNRGLDPQAQLAAFRSTAQGWGQGY